MAHKCVYFSELTSGKKKKTTTSNQSSKNKIVWFRVILFKRLFVLLYPQYHACIKRGVPKIFSGLPRICKVLYTVHLYLNFEVIALNTTDINSNI